MSDLIVSERRGPEWKQRWAERTLSSMAPPPLPLLAVFAVVIFYLYLSDSYERVLFGLKVFMFLLPVFFFLLLRGTAENGGGGGSGVFKFPNFMTENRGENRGGGAGRVALLLLLVLLLISCHPSLKSKWSVSSS